MLRTAWLWACGGRGASSELCTTCCGPGQRVGDTDEDAVGGCIQGEGILEAHGSTPAPPARTPASRGLDFSSPAATEGSSTAGRAAAAAAADATPEDDGEAESHLHAVRRLCLQFDEQVGIPALHCPPPPLCQWLFIGEQLVLSLTLELAPSNSRASFATYVRYRVEAFKYNSSTADLGRCVSADASYRLRSGTRNNI